jgi:predicted  nucleic acid-binding Zn-ribbon protein
MSTQNVKENLHTIIDKSFAKMEELKKSAAQSTAEMRKSVEHNMQSLEVKKQELESRMAELRGAAEEKRDELAEAAAKSAESFREGLDQMASVFGKEPMVRK